MTRRIPVLIGTLVLALAVVYAWWPSSRPAPKPVTVPERLLSCSFSPGEELAFHVRATSMARASKAEAPQQLELEATLWWRVIEDRSSTGWVMAAALSQVQLLEGGVAQKEPERLAALESPFLIQVDRDCRFRDFAFDASVSAEARRQLQGMLQASEIILPPLRRTQWVSRHRDSLGEFDASYTLEPSTAEGVVELSRHHGRYISSSLPMLPPQLGGRMRVDVLSSGTHATLDPQGRWARQVDGAEQLRVWMGSKLLSDVSSTVQVERVEGATGAPQLVAEVDASRFSWASVRTGAHSEPGLPPPPEPALAALDLDGALADFSSRISAGSNQGVHVATERLASYLSVHPKAIGELLSRIRGGTIPERLQPMLFLALEKTGTLAAESGLASALKDPGQGTLNRMRAAAALQDVPRPTERTARILIDQARGDRSGPEERQVADASLLALGALSHRVETRQPEVGSLAHDELATRLQEARDSEDASLALDAIGNSGDERFADTLRSYTEDSSPIVRAHAARAWRRMDSSTQAPVLANWLLQEQDARVRRAIADSMAEQVRDVGGPISPAILSAAATRLATEPDVKTRAALIALLGSAASNDASARLALVQQFKRETVPDLQVLIGRYVRADELQ